MEQTGAFVKIIGSCVSWTFLLIALSMFKNFISRGFSMALAEFMLNGCDENQRAKYVRWFGNGEMVLEHLKKLDEKSNETK